MFTIDDFTFTYPGRDNPFDVRVDTLTLRSNVSVILGANGSGKTTFINGLTRLYPARFQQTPAHYRVMKHSAFSQLPHIRLRDYLRDFAVLHGIALAQVDVLLAELGLSALQDKQCNQLSSGQQARAKLIATLLSSPDVVAFDEPSTACDLLAIDTIVSMINHLANQGTQVIVVSHNLLEIAQLTPDLIVFYQGRMVGHYAWQSAWDNSQQLYNDCQRLLNNEDIGVPSLSMSKVVSRNKNMTNEPNNRNDALVGQTAPIVTMSTLK